MTARTFPNNTSNSGTKSGRSWTYARPSGELLPSPIPQHDCEKFHVHSSCVASYQDPFWFPVHDGLIFLILMTFSWSLENVQKTFLTSHKFYWGQLAPTRRRQFPPWWDNGGRWGPVLSPSLKNLITLTWLRRIHKDLPFLVKQKYGPDLRAKTLASLKQEIAWQSYGWNPSK